MRVLSRWMEKKITGKHNNKEIMNEIHNYIHFALKLFKKAQ